MKNFLRLHRKPLLLAGLFLFIGALVVFYHPLSAFAQAPQPAATPTKGQINIPLIPDIVLRVLAAILLALTRLFLSITLFALTFIIEVAGYNGYLDATAVNIGWVMVRDLANMFFVVVLLIIAFGTILGLEHYEWKKMLVKFVAAAILVNFSRLICGVIIDIGQLVMITFVNGIAATAGGNLINAFQLDKIRDLSGSNQPINDSGIFLASVGAITFAAIVMYTMIAFLVMLVARMLVLWILIVLSPLAFALSILPQTEGYAHEWWGQFGANIVTGPALLFFVWLAFVTVGNGHIHDEIMNNSSVPDSNKISTANLDQNSGIGGAMGWNNIANFVIAIGMLFVGAETASKLGGIGAGWASGAIDFGKKVAAVASGFAAARYVADKGIEAGKAAGQFALAKAPLVGGDAWKRRGEKIGALASVGWSKLNVLRDKGAQSLEGEAKDIQKLKSKLALGEITKAEYDLAMGKYGGLGGFLRRGGKSLLSGGIESAGRKEKQVEDLKKAAESQHKIEEESYSTSSLAGGRLKLRLGVEAEQAEKLAEEKKKLKYAEEEKKRLLEGGEFAKKERTVEETKVTAEKTKLGLETMKAEEALEAEEHGKLAEAKAKAKKEEIKLGTRKAEGEAIAAEKVKLAEAEAIAKKAEIVRHGREELEKEHAAGKVGLLDVEAIAERDKIKLHMEEAKQKREAEERAGLYGLKAEQEQKTFEATEESEQKLAKARDEYLRGAGRHSEAVNLQNVMAKQAKARVDRQSVGDYVLSEARTKAQLERIADLQAQGASQDKIDQAQKSLSEMAMGNLGRHAAFAEGNKGLVLGDINRQAIAQGIAPMSRAASMEITPDEIRNLQAQLMAFLVGKKVEATAAGLQQAVNEFQTMHGERAGALLEQVRLQAEQAAGQGSVGLAGLLNTEILPDGTQRTTLTDVNAKGLGHVAARRTSALSGARITSLAGGFSGSVDRRSDGKIVVKSDQSIDTLVKIMSPMTNNMITNLDEYVKTDLADIFDYSELGDVGKLLAHLVSEVKDKPALKRMLGFAAARMSDAARKTQLEAFAARI